MELFFGNIRIRQQTVYYAKRATLSLLPLACIYTLEITLHVKSNFDSFTSNGFIINIQPDRRTTWPHV